MCVCKYIKEIRFLQLLLENRERSKRLNLEKKKQILLKRKLVRTIENIRMRPMQVKTIRIIIWILQKYNGLINE